LKCELFPDQAPLTVKNFIGLAKGTKPWKDGTGKQVTNKPLYNGVIFHRTIPGFMIQGGDPTGTGAGDVGFEFANEVHPDLLFDRPGRLAMANRGPDTNSSQFFITEVPVAYLNGGYTIFGQCDDATVDLVKKVANMPCQGGQTCTGGNSRPQNPVKINHVEIVSAGAGAKPSAGKTGAKTPAKPKPSPSAQ
jgi:peptidyl-prolyl cis-trans isomerase A (cyclophilin A)